MKTFELGTSGVTASSVVLGLMRIGTLEDDAIRKLYTTARDLGVTVFDHADIYGGSRHHCEQRFGEAVRLSAAEREAIVLQSKCGIRRRYFDFSKEHILNPSTARWQR